MPILARITQIAGIGTCLLGVTVLVGAALAPRLEQAALGRVVLEVETRAGVQLEVAGGAQIRLPGSVTLHDVTMSRDGFAATCDTVRVEMPFRQSWQRTFVAESVVVGDCWVHRADGSSETEPTEPPDPLRADTAQTRVERIFDAIHELGDRTESLDVASVCATEDVHEAVGEVSVCLRDIAFAETRGWVGFDVDVTGGALVSGGVRLMRADRIITFEPDAPMQLGEHQIAVDDVAIHWDEHVVLTHVEATEQRFGYEVTVSLAEVEVDLETADGAPRVVINGGTVAIVDPSAAADANPDDEFERAGNAAGGVEDSAEDNADTDPDEEGIPSLQDQQDDETQGDADDGPSVGQRIMNAALAGVDEVFALADRARQLEVPDGAIDVHDLRISAPGFSADAIVVSEATWRPDQRVAATLTVGGIDVSIATNLRSLENVVFTASNVGLDAVGPFIQDDVVTGGTLSLDAALVLDPETNSLALDATFAVNDGLFEHSTISSMPLADMQIEGSVAVDVSTSERSASVHTELSFNGVPIDLHVDAVPDDEGPDDPSWSLDVAFGLTERTQCQDIYDGFPDGMLPNLGPDGMRFVGASQLRFAYEYRLNDPQTFDLTASGFPDTCDVTYIRPEFDPAQLNDPMYVQHVQEGVTDPFVFVGPGTPGYLRLDEVPSYVPASMYLSEEIDFYSNPGVSLRLINKGIRYSLEHSRYAYGGSTISQQLVKNLFLSRSKNLARKLEEVLIVWVMERDVTKDRIIEMYMNCVEFGPDVYGISAASYHYFGQPAADLTPLQSVYIAALKPRPSSGARHLRRGNSPTGNWWSGRLEELLERLVRYGGHIPAEEVQIYAPFVVPFPTSPNFANVEYPAIPRPTGGYTLEGEDGTIRRPLNFGRGG